MLVSCAVIGGAGVIATHETASATGSLNGVAGSMPAYYDHQLFTINFKQLVVSGATLQSKNSQLNIIWQSDPGLPGGQPFISVIDAIPADGMNPLWVECQITFNSGHTPRQFFSDNEVEAAQQSGEITVTDTHELYRCSVIGQKPSITSGAARAAGAFAAHGPTAATGTQNAAPAGQSKVSWGQVKRAYR